MGTSDGTAGTTVCPACFANRYPSPVEPGLGIAHAAGCHSHPAGINFASILTDYTPDPGFVKEQLFCLPLPEFGAAALYIPVQGIDYIRCPVTHRERPGFHAQS